MTGETLRHKVTITNPQGLHLRPITAFAEAAGRFQSSVTVVKEDGGMRVNGKSPISLLGLAAEQGAELTIEVIGPDAKEAMPLLIEILSRPAPPEGDKL
jgi:phosphotransferase system HPr (HPr) family protein